MSASSLLLDLLRGGDLRSIGRVAEVVERADDDPTSFDTFFSLVHRA